MMKRILLTVTAILLVLSSCNLSPDHTITLQATGSGVAAAGIYYRLAGTSYPWAVQTLPWTTTLTGKAGGIELYADTESATSGTVTITILIDGVVQKTASVTAPASPPPPLSTQIIMAF
jgi:hypothetical protein